MSSLTGFTPELIEYECECLDNKKFRILFDGDSSGNYIINFCQKCYDSDDKQFMISSEELF